MKHMPNRALIVIGAALALGIGGGVAVAQIPSTDGTITACMTPPAGTVRLIDAEAGATCKKGEKLVTWNEAGQPGTNGVSGYEVVRDEGIQTTSTGGFIAFSQGVACPAGKKMLGWFASGFNVPGTPGGGGVLDAAYSDLFVNSDGEDQVTVEFTKGNGQQFGAGDAAHWRIEITCAAVS